MKMQQRLCKRSLIAVANYKPRQVEVEVAAVAEVVAAPEAGPAVDLGSY